MDLGLQEAMLRILVALVLGAIIGAERELTFHSAGLRTHMLVSVGAAVFMILSISNLLSGVSMGDFDMGALNGTVNYNINMDPGRIAAQVVSGIGFIGGGAVLRYGVTIRGLTTATSLWLVAGIGMLAGCGHYALALYTTLITIVVLVIIARLWKFVAQKAPAPYDRLRLLVTAMPVCVPDVQMWVTKNFGDKILEIKTSTSQDSTSTAVTYILNIASARLDVTDVSRNVNAIPGVSSSAIRVYTSEEENHFS